MFNLSRWAIEKPAPPILLFFTLVVVGLLGFKQLPIQNFPDIDVPTVTVSATMPGATPTQLETEVVRKLEDSFATIEGVKHISSTLTTGGATTSIEFMLEKNTQQAVDDVKDALSRIRMNLPADLQDPVVQRMTTSGAPILTYAVSAEGKDLADLSWFVDNMLGKRLQAIPGVGKVTRLGGVDREIAVLLNPAKLQSLGVSAADVSRQLAQTEKEFTGGEGRLAQQEQTVRTIGSVHTAAEVGQLPLALPDGRHLRLADVATVRDQAPAPRQLAFLDGKPVLAFQVYRAPGASEVQVLADVTNALQALAKQTPSVHTKLVSDTVHRVAANYTGSIHSLYEGAFLTIAVVLFFLRNSRATLISAVAQPLSILPTFMVLNWLGFTLNGITLLALTLVTGVLVDDAIVEVENIIRHLHMGKSPRKAAIDATSEIGLAVIATSLTLVAVFLPTAFMSGIPGKFFKQFGWAASVAVLASLLVARMVTPLLAAYFINASKEQAPPDGWLMRRYLKLVTWCLSNPGKTVLAALVFFIVSIVLVARMPAAFIPASDQNLITVNAELPPGVAIAETLKAVKQAESAISPLPGVLNVFSSIGTAGQAGGVLGTSTRGDVRKASLLVSLAPHEQRQQSQQDLERILRQNLDAIPGVRFTLGSGAAGEKLTLNLAGEDSVLLDKAAKSIISELRQIPGLGSVSTSASLLQPELQVVLNAPAMADLGITPASLGAAIRVATAGDSLQNVAKLDLPERQLPVTVRLPDVAKSDIATFEQLRIPAKVGSVPLGNVAELQLASGPAEISRYDRNRTVTLTAELNGLPLGQVSKTVQQLPSVLHLPPGVRLAASGDAERMAELFASFGTAMAISLFCVYAVLVLLFHDFAQPLTILAAMPLSAGGAFGALMLTGHSLSLPALLGLLMLMGIVTKNSILLVEYALVARKAGASRTASLIDACHKRVRPIVMTTVAMLAGMFPMALGLEGDPTFRAPMAIAVMGGLLTSTILSILVVPVVFELVDSAKVWLLRKINAK